MVGMEIAVVFESMYGATHEVADAIAAGIAEADPGATVTCARVGDADPDRAASADLLIVGGPTHMRGMSSGMSRKLAVTMEEKKEQEGRTFGHGLEPGAEGAGLRDWFHELPKAHTGRWAAAFDTRGEGHMVGAAAKGIAHRLEGHGYDLVADPEGFLVEGDAQLLRAGERERARNWAATLVRQAATAGPPR
jgi:flavodoxin